MPKRIEITGQKFNMLTAEEYVGKDEKGCSLWRFRCDCGKEIVEVGSKVKSGRKKSCGCRQGLFQDHTGEKFNHLTAIECVGRANDGNPVWLCRCDCGNLHEVSARNLTHGYVKSCGCLRHVAYRATHGESSSRLFNVWNAMKQRCSNSNNTSWKLYGGRGIKVCDEWSEDYEAFRDWAYANCYDEDAPHGQCTIDRIDVNGDYEPANCRWVDAKTQCNNTRTNRYIEIGGERKTVTEWCSQNGINVSTAYSRLRDGWDEARAVTFSDREATRKASILSGAKPVTFDGLGTFESIKAASDATGISEYRIRGALKRGRKVDGYHVEYAR